MSDPLAKGIVFRGVITFAQAIIDQSERLHLAFNNKMLGQERWDIRLKYEEYLFLMAGAQFFRFMRRAIELNLFDDKKFQNIDEFADVTKDLRDMNEHIDAYIGLEKGRLGKKQLDFVHYSPDWIDDAGNELPIRADQSLFNGRYQIGGRLDVQKFSDAAAELLQNLRN